MPHLCFIFFLTLCIFSFFSLSYSFVVTLLKSEDTDIYKNYVIRYNKVQDIQTQYHLELLQKCENSFCFIRSRMHETSGVNCRPRCARMLSTRVLPAAGLALNLASKY